MSKFLQKEVINSKELEDLLAGRNESKIDFRLIDVREQSEYNRGYIQGVDELRPTSMFEHWASEVFEINKDTTLILTCRTGNRSGMLQNIFKRHGHPKVINHIGGILSYNGKIITP
ncbi:MAG: rhodanese-like domain-containing protein [Campylobacterota bacterium]|nr:rhodanese-like domain-containing protein [Campylobacterota bacterium]